MNLIAKLTRLGALLAASAAVTCASPVFFDLQGVTFNDGASGSGYFVFDPSLSQFSYWSIVTTSSGTGAIIGPFSGFDYNPLTSGASAGSPGCAAEFVDTLDASQSLCLATDSPLVAGASPALLATSFESSGSGERFVSAGTLPDPNNCPSCGVPEPSTFNFVGLGSLGLLAMAIWRLLPRGGRSVSPH